jgi:uridine kinase
MHRQEVIHTLAARIAGVKRDHPVRVGVDGITAAGKTTLADNLAEALRGGPREVIRASVDDFHNPPAVRYRRGRLSPEGYYLDTFDYPALRERLLPLGSRGSRRYRAGALGQPDGASAAFAERTASENAILIVDGVFLFRPELNDYWDYRIFIAVDLKAAVERGIARDAGWMGSYVVARERYEQRYVPGERLYLESVRPWELADAVVENDDPARPGLRFPADAGTGASAAV